MMIEAEFRTAADNIIMHIRSEVFWKDVGIVELLQWQMSLNPGSL